MTIFALSTGSNKSGIAIIRISGPDTKIALSNDFNFLSKISMKNGIV